MVKCLGRKKAIHESMKNELLTFPKDQNRIRNARNTCFKRWKYGGKLGIQRYRLHKHKKTNSGHFMSLFKEGRQVHLHDMGTSNNAIGHRLKLKKDTYLKCTLLYTKRIYILVQDNGMMPIDQY
jgi:hypothetical protein